jgi:hypothetical protein
MATFNQSLTRMRRFLRDPDANIWDSEQIRLYWNQSQLEIADKIDFIERIRAHSYPPLYVFTYMRDWEIQHLEGDLYQCFHNWPTRDYIICYPWEPGYYLTDSSLPDDGYRFTHPWESAYGAPADVVRIPLHEKFHKMKFCAFDEEQIHPLAEREIASVDRYYRTTAGRVCNYYRPDGYENDIVLYPRVGSITWDDAMWLLTDASDAFSDTLGDGIISYFEDGFDESDTGIIWDSVDIDEQLFMIFEALPDEVEESTTTWDDEISWWPPYMIPMVEYATLARCYGADTDGFIPSLRDYWELRKKIGIEVIKQFKHKRLSDRDFQMGGKLKPIRSKHPKLPSGYPATYP